MWKKKKKRLIRTTAKRRDPKHTRWKRTTTMWGKNENNVFREQQSCVRSTSLLWINKRAFLKSLERAMRRDICGVRYDREHWWAKTTATAAAATDTRTRCVGGGGGAPKIRRRRGIERGGRTPRARTLTRAPARAYTHRIKWPPPCLVGATTVRAAASVERYTMCWRWRRDAGETVAGSFVRATPYYGGKTTPPPRSSAVACPRRRRRRRRRRLVGRRRLLHRRLCRSGSVCARSLFPALPPPPPLEPRPCVYITRVCTGCPMMFNDDSNVRHRFVFHGVHGPSLDVLLPNEQWPTNIHD